MDVIVLNHKNKVSLQVQHVDIGMLKKMLDDNNIDVVAKMKEWRK